MSRNELLAFRAAGSEWVMPVADVEEILESPRVIRLPLLSGEIPGIVDVRGAAVPAVAMSGLDPAARRSAILTRTGSRRVALLVDLVDGIVDAPPPNASEIDVAALFERTAP